MCARIGCFVDGHAFGAMRCAKHLTLSGPKRFLTVALTALRGDYLLAKWPYPEGIMRGRQRIEQGQVSGVKKNDCPGGHGHDGVEQSIRRVPARLVLALALLIGLIHLFPTLVYWTSN